MTWMAVATVRKVAQKTRQGQTRRGKCRECGRRGHRALDCLNNSSTRRRASPRLQKGKAFPRHPRQLKPSTFHAPAEPQNLESNTKISPKETSPEIAKAAFLRCLKATAQIRAISDAIYIARNHSISVPFQLRTRTRQINQEALLDSGTTKCFVNR